MFTSSMTEEFFTIIDYSRVENRGEAVDVVAIKKRIEDKIYKEEDKMFKCRVIIKDNCIKQRLRILC